MSHDGKVPVVPAMSWAKIGNIAQLFLQRTYPDLLREPGPFPVEEFIEYRMRQAWGFKLAIQELPEGIEAAMDPKEKLVILSPETYEDITNGVPRARFTGVHEIAHVILHAKYLRHRILDGEKIMQLNRGNIKPYRDPECQANACAAALLMPTHHMAKMVAERVSIFSIADTFNVSFEAAGYRVDGLHKYL